MKGKFTMKNFLIGFLLAIVLLIVGACVFFFATPLGKSIYNQWQYSLEKVDEKTYETQKEVEGVCRAMIASYTQDKMIYEQYKDSNVEEERSWANSAKIRANNTASTYNNYILENSYVWNDNVPNDIAMKLEYLE